jgi:hypothetical protein
MSALMLMPIVVEMIVAGKSLQILMYSCLLLLQMTVLEGKMGPVAWIPMIIHASVAVLLPASVPPDAPRYITRGIKQESKDSW